MDQTKMPPKKRKFDTKSPCPSCGERVGCVESYCPFCGDEIPLKSWLRLSNDKTGRVILGVAVFLLSGYFFTIFYFWGELLSKILIIMGLPFYVLAEAYAYGDNRRRRK